jgi:hypothetical protein
MVALGGIAGTRGGPREVFGGDLAIAGPLVEVATHRIEAVVLRQPRIEPVQRAQSGERAVHLAHRDRAAEAGRRVVGQFDQLVVPLEDLRPVGLLGARRVVVQRRDRRLDLVLTATFLRQRLLQQRDTLTDLRRVPQ